MPQFDCEFRQRRKQLNISCRFVSRLQMRISNTTMDVEALLQKHTLVELKDIEKKLRTDVERKKEDLRELVSMRYRDLIDAADKITGMHTSIVKVTGHLRDLHLQDQNGRPRMAAQSAKNSRDSQSELNELISTLLIASPEIIFTFLDNEDPLTAAVLFSFARNGVWQFNATQPEVAGSSPGREWNFLRAHGDFIYQNAVSMFEKTYFQPGEMMSYICAVMLLRTTTTKMEILEIFFSKRTLILRQLLTLSSTFPVRESIELTLSSICSSIRAVHEVIGQDAVPHHMNAKSGLIRNAVFSSIYPNISPVHTTKMDEIFSSVINSVSSETEDWENIRERFKIWLAEIPNIFSEPLSNVLGFIISFQSLFAVRKSIEIILSDEEKSASSLKKLAKDLGVSYLEIYQWLSAAVQSRFGNILREKLAELWTETMELLRLEIVDVEKLTLESSALFVPSFIGIDASGKFTKRKKFPGKTRRAPSTPEHQPKLSPTSFGNFQSKLNQIFLDIKQRYEPGNPDMYWIQDVIPPITSEFLRNFTADIKNLAKEPKSSTKIDHHRRLYYFLNSLSSQTFFLESVQIIFRKEVHASAEFVFSDWLTEVLESWRKAQLERLVKELDPEFWSQQIFPFQKVFVEELNEAGENAGYIIHCPSQSSAGLFAALQDLHEKLVGFGKGIISDSGIQQCFDTVFKSYDEFLNLYSGKLLKNQSVQIAFDLKFVQSLGRTRKGFPISITRNFQGLIDKVSGELDPIDYNSLLPYLDKNVTVFVSSVKGLLFWFCNIDPGSTELISAEVSKSMNAQVILKKDIWFSSLPVKN